MSCRFLSSRFAVIALLATFVLIPARTWAGKANTICQWNGYWVSDGPMNSPRSNHSATLLQNGKVLIAGGLIGNTSTSSAELYDPAAGSYTPTGSMNTDRHSHTATLLNDGRVLITGGFSVQTGSRLSSAEVYDPNTGTFSFVGSMSTNRQYQAATLLPNGQVLVSGGFGIIPGFTFSGWLQAADIFDPSTNSFSATGAMANGRGLHTSTLLQNGMVLVVGGVNTNGTLASAEIFNPATGSWTTVGSLTTARSGHTANLLAGGNVVIAGGGSNGVVLGSMETFDIATNSFFAAGNLLTARSGHVALTQSNGSIIIAGGSDGTNPVLSAELSYGGTPIALGTLPAAGSNSAGVALPDGTSLITGGTGVSNVVLSSAELYDPAWILVGPMITARQSHTATKLDDGSILFAGGSDLGGFIGFNSAERFFPQATPANAIPGTTPGMFVATGSMAQARHDHLAVKLADGRVLAAGGSAHGPIFSSAEIYDPASGTWSSAGSMSVPREWAAGVLMLDGRVLVTGGFDGTGGTKATEIYNPATNAWSTTGNLNFDRYRFQAILRADGTVFVAGGWSDTDGGITYTTEIYNPATGTWTSSPQPDRLIVDRENFTATTMDNGLTLYAGGLTQGDVVVSTAEEYNPNSNSFSLLNHTMSVARQLHAACTTFMPNGQVMISGGSSDFSGTGPFTSVELFDPTTLMFSLTAPMNEARIYHTQTLLDDGRVLVAGGASNGYAEVSKNTICNPHIDSLSPASGVAGTQVTIIGVGFTNVTGSVTFNGVTASIVSWSPTQIVVTVPNGATTGPVVVTADGNPSNGVNFTVTPSADLSIIKGASPNPVTVGQNLTYIISVSNIGPDAATNVVVQDALPAAVTFVSSTPSQGTCSGTVQCNLGTVAAGAGATITIVVKVNSVGTITNTATVSATEFDPNTTNNSWTVSVNALATGVDLVVTSVSSPPPGAAITATIRETETVYNQGSAAAGASVTRYYLSTTPAINSSAIRLTGSRSVPGLASQASSAGAANYTVPSNVPSGVYYVLACANDTRTVVESNYANDCTPAPTTMRVVGADLAETAVTNPPSTANVGSAFVVTDTTQNIGTNNSGNPTVTRYYLSPTASKTSSSIRLTGSRTVPPLAPSASSSGSVTVSTPGMLPGTYFLLACANDTRTAVENNYSNNCLAASTSIVITAPDMVETAISNPPSTANLGDQFAVTDNTLNQGNDSTVVTSVTRYYLSPTAAKTASSHLLIGSRMVPILAPSAASAGTVTVSIPSMPAGTYFLLACANDTHTVVESNSSNNCLTAASNVVVSAPDLIEGSVSSPPASANLSTSFTVAETTTNIGNGTAAASVTRFYLSLTAARTSSSIVLTGSRSVVPLTSGASSSGTTTVTIPSMAAGTYFLLACANDTHTIVESNYANNCAAAASMIVVTAPDLVETAVSNPPATAGLGSSFPVGDRAANIGNGPSGISVTYYYLSLTPTLTSSSRQLNGTRTVPALAPGGSSIGSASAMVPTATPGGSYFLLACANGTRSVVESNYANNCVASTTRVSIP